MPDARANRLIEIAVVLVVCAFLFFYGLGSFGLLGADEPRYAQIGLEMLQRRDWIVPTLNGTPWLEKPPLLYWGEMASYAAFGPHDWAARVPIALMTTAMVLAIYGFVRWQLPGWQMHAALITASLAAIVGFGRGASTDMPLTACFTIAMLAWFEWHAGGPRAWLLAFYGLCALGMLAKGPVAPFLAGVTVVAFAVLRREWKLVLKTLWLPGILLFLAVSLPWYIAVQLKTGDFFRVFILEHNLARFGTDLYRHKQPFWYYLPVVVASTLPWAAVLVAGLVRSCKLAFRDSDPFQTFLLLWFAVPVVFFSLSQSKLPGYVLPAIPPAALLIVSYLRERKDRLPTPIVLLHALLCGALLSGVLLSPHFLIRVRPPANAIATAIIAGLAIAALVALTIFRRGIRVAYLITLIPVLLSVGFIVKVAAPAVDSTQSARPVAQEIARVATSDAQIVVFGVPRPLGYGIQYYRRSAVVIPAGEPLPDPPYAYVLVTREGTNKPTRTQALVGSYPPQRIEIYVVGHR